MCFQSGLLDLLNICIRSILNGLDFIFQTLAFGLCLAYAFLGFLYRCLGPDLQGIIGICRAWITTVIIVEFCDFQLLLSLLQPCLLVILLIRFRNTWQSISPPQRIHHAIGVDRPFAYTIVRRVGNNEQVNWGFPALLFLSACGGFDFFRQGWPAEILVFNKDITIGMFDSFAISLLDVMGHWPSLRLSAHRLSKCRHALIHRIFTFDKSWRIFGKIRRIQHLSGFTPPCSGKVVKHIADNGTG
ncbi:hypothetical protein UF16_20770 [Chromobacterium violaceum]|nr:hypothetical protein UF16_20770 [Chromobacterium violaceum]